MGEAVKHRYDTYYYFALFFKWTPDVVDRLPASLIVYLSERLRDDAEALLVAGRLI
ncbi:hypothetical protein D3C81_2276010 [compost metagenome]